MATVGSRVRLVIVGEVSRFSTDVLEMRVLTGGCAGQVLYGGKFFCDDGNNA